MAIAYDAFSRVTTAAAGNLSWTHTPTGTPKGVIVFVVAAGGSADQITTVTYGGVSLTEVSGSPSQHAATEATAVHCFFVGANIPTGAQTVAVSTSTTGQIAVGYCVTVTAATSETAVQNTVVLIDNIVTSNPTTSLALSGVTCFVAEAFGSGTSSAAGINSFTGWTHRDKNDFGSQMGCCSTYDTIASADVTCGANHGTDELNLLAIAVREQTVSTAVKDMIGSGFIAFAR